MYEAFYGLAEKPFSLTPDPKYLYLSRAHQEALDHLLYGVQEREGFIVITGDVGTGKTTLCRALLAKLDQRARIALILNPMLSEEELLRAVLEDFGLPGAGSTKKELIDELNDFLIQTLTDGQRAVLILDEAQDLSPRLLEQIRMLSNLETERQKLIQIILVGQLELLDLLASPELKPLNQRVSVRYQLRPLSFQETCQYVYHRLLVAGGGSRVTISAPALKLIHRFSHGVPRLINLAADRTLLRGFVDQSAALTRRRAQEAIRSLRQDTGAGAKSRSWRGRLALATAGLAVVGFAGGWLAAKAWERSPGTLAPPTVVLPAGAPSGAGDQPFTLLVTASPVEAQAHEIERRLAARGYTPFVATWTTARGERHYGVLVGRFRGPEEAAPLQNRLAAAEGFSDVKVVRLAQPSGGSDRR